MRSCSRRSRSALAVLVVLLSAHAASAQPKSLRSGEFTPGPREPEAPYVDLLTFGEGERIFEKFGHAALCLRYHDVHITPVCFNYGVTDFDGGTKLIWGFLRSEQKFWVEPSTLGNMIGFYRWEDRDIWRQTLPLTDEQSRALEAELWDSLREERRYYYYDHFLDNCSTRLRDMIDKVTGKLRPGSDVAYPLTFRDLGRRGLAEYPVLLVLTDFIIGRQVDDHPTLWQAMFHPVIFRAEVEKRFGATPELIYQRHGFEFPQDGPSGRDVVFAVGLLFMLPLLAARSRTKLRYAIAAAFVAALTYVLVDIASLSAGMLGAIGVVFALPMILVNLMDRRGEAVALGWALVFLGLCGLIVWGLAILSPIAGLRWNEAVLVFTPLDLALPFLGARRRQRYARVRVGLLVLASLLCAIGILHQPLWVPIVVAFMPLAILAFDLPRPMAKPEPVIDTAERAA
jgi:uncharacterized protein DUF4105